jgi:hypothetical protein
MTALGAGLIVTPSRKLHYLVVLMSINKSLIFEQSSIYIDTAGFQAIAKQLINTVIHRNCGHQKIFIR